MALRFSQSYQPGMWTGEMLRVRCEDDGVDHITLTISSIKEMNFKDANGPEWVLSFGPNEPEFRLRARQWQTAKALAAEFGDDGDKWAGQQVALKPRFVEWTDRDSGEKKSGTTIDLIPVPPAAGAVVEQPASLDDEIPF